MEISKGHYGVLLTILSAMFFGTGAIIIKLAYQVDLTNWEFLSLQYICSCAMLMPIYFISRRKYTGKPMSKEKLGRLALQGVLGAFGGAVFLFTGFKYIGAAVGTVLFYTYPAFVALGARIFFREALGIPHYFCLSLTFIGAILTIDFWSLSLEEISLKGTILILLSALCYAFFSLYGQKNLKEFSSLEITAYTQLFALVACIIIKPPVFLFQGVSWYAIFLGFIMAFFTSVCSYFLLLKGMALIGASRSSVISTFEIPFTIILAFIILGEKLTIIQFFGAALIISGIVYLHLS